MIYMRNITITTAKSATYLENVGCIAVAIVHYQPEFARLSIGKLVALGGLSALHLMYFVFAINQKAMLDASAIYARQLVLSAEILMKRG